MFAARPHAATDCVASQARCLALCRMLLVNGVAVRMLQLRPTMHAAHPCRGDLLALLGYDCAALSLELRVPGVRIMHSKHTIGGGQFNSLSDVQGLGRCRSIGLHLFNQHALSAGQGADDLTLALTAVRQLQTRLSGVQPGADNADPSRLSQAVSHAVKAAMRLRKAIVDAAYLDCSDSMAAMLAEALEAAAALVESPGGLTSAAGAAPDGVDTRRAEGCRLHVEACRQQSSRHLCGADGVTPLQHERGHQAASLMITAAELRARPVFVAGDETDHPAAPVCKPDAFRWLLDGDHADECASRA